MDLKSMLLLATETWFSWNCANDIVGNEFTCTLRSPSLRRPYSPEWKMDGLLSWESMSSK